MANSRKRIRKAATPKVAPGKISDAKLRRARQEDRLDAAWRRQCDRLLAAVAKNSGHTGFSLLELVSPTLPPHPTGYLDRLRICNRCGQQTEHNERHDAYFCPRCRRWIEPRCSDPKCEFCNGRPLRPPP